MLWQLTSHIPLTLTVYGKLPDTVDIVLVQWGNWINLNWDAPLPASAEIYPISSYAAKHKPVITDSASLHSVLASDNPYEELKGLISPWNKAILDLIQLVCGSFSVKHQVQENV